MDIFHNCMDKFTHFLFDFLCIKNFFKYFNLIKLHQLVIFYFKFFFKAFIVFFFFIHNKILDKNSIKTNFS